VSKHLPPHFVLFKPKDIVSGDFYWKLEKNDHLYLAAADCTGHGVPGAFLTMLGVSFLNEINADARLLTPAQILDQLRDRIIKELGQTGKAMENKDGMDISLLRLNLKTYEALWAGANNPLFYVEANGNLIEVKADKQPVAHYAVMNPFNDNVINFKKGDAFYLFTDGYADQFGGPSGKKFKYKQLQEKLIETLSLPVEDQKKKLNLIFEEWRGKLEQIDDVCVIGMRL
jgi:serine phosphatase RsbU (regulator of sigma subunit)